MVLLEQFLIHARLVIEAFKVGFADQLDKILIAGEIGGQQDEMIVVVMRQSAFPALSVAGRHVGLTAYDGLDPASESLLIKLDSPEQIAMVRHGHGGHAEVFHLLDERLNLIRPIEQAVLGVEVKMNEWLGRQVETSGRIVIGRGGEVNVVK